MFGLATLVSFFALMVAGVNRADESWNLHLIDRMLHGDVLYADIRYFPTPLALFAGVAAAAAFGTKVVVLKALIAVSFGATAVANLFIVRRLGAGGRGQVLLVAALLLFAIPPPSSLYNTLVITLASVTAALVLRWDAALHLPASVARSRRLFRRATAVGIAAGMCALAKYNIGAAVALATAGSMAVALFQRRVSLPEFAASGLAAAGACLLTALVGLSPVIVQGASVDFVRQLLDGRDLIDAPVPYGYFFGRLVRGIGDLSTLEIRNFATYGLAPLAAVVGAVAIVRTQSVVRGRLLMVVLFALASAVLAFPRADHMPWVLPLPLALLIGSAAQTIAPLRKARPVLMTALATCSLGFAVTWLALALFLDGSTVRHLAVVGTGPFQGALEPPDRWRNAMLEAAEIRGQVGSDRRVLILRLEAGFYYLAADLHNPTRYHYPDAYEFGTAGLADVTGKLVSRAITYTCIGRDYPPELEPAPVIAAVRAHSHFVAKLSACDLWRTGPDPRRVQ